MVITEYSRQHLLSFNCCIYAITPVRANSRHSEEHLVDQFFTTIDTVPSPSPVLGTPKPKAHVYYIMKTLSGQQQKQTVNVGRILLPMFWAGPQDSLIGLKHFLAHLYFLPVGASSSEHEVAVEVVLLMREIRVCINVHHPRSAITTDT